MARKTEFTREAILNAAIAALGKHDLGQLTARLLAKELHSSTAPIYQQFGSMEELTRAVLGRVSEMLSAECRVQRSDRVFLDIGLGYVLFARDNPGLFRALLLEKHGYRAAVDRFFEDARNRMRQDARFVSLEKPLQELLFTEMWIYSHGLAAMVISGIIRNRSDKAITERLQRMGQTVIQDILSRAQ